MTITMKDSMRKCLLIAATLTLMAGSAQAGKPKDSRFANPSDPDGLKSSAKLRKAALQRAPQGTPFPSAPSTSQNSSGVLLAAAGGSRGGGSHGGGHSNSHSSSHHGGSGIHHGNSSNHGHDSHGSHNSHNSHESHGGLSLSLGGHSSYSYGHYSYPYSSHSYYPSYSYRYPYYSSHRYSYYPSYGYSYGYPNYSNRHGGIYSAYSPTVILYESNTYADDGLASASSRYRGSRNGPWPYETGQYQAQAQASTQGYQDLQRSTAQDGAAGSGSVAQATINLPQGVTPSDRQAAALRQGWTLVAQGKAKEAVTLFAVECEADARLAQSKIGYAIAAALAGESAAAKWGIRRAFGLQSDGLAYLPAVEGLTDQMNGLSQLLWSSMAGRAASADDWFLLASVDYLRHDLDSASKAAQEAADLGDTSPSLRNLRAQIAAEAGN